MHIMICPQLHKGLYQDGEQDLSVTIPICDFIRSPSALTLLKLPSQKDLGILSPRAAFIALPYSKRDRDAHKIQAVRNSIVTFNPSSGKEEESNILQEGMRLRNKHLDLFTTVLSTSRFHFRHPRGTQHTWKGDLPEFISRLYLQPHPTNPIQHLPLWITDSLLCRCSRARTIWGQTE